MESEQPALVVTFSEAEAMPKLAKVVLGFWAVAVFPLLKFHFQELMVFPAGTKVESEKATAVFWQEGDHRNFAVGALPTITTFRVSINGQPFFSM